MNRYFNEHLGRHVVKIMPGEYALARGSDVLVTVVGSCVTACIRDERKHIGGMNHFMLPVYREGSAANISPELTQAARYGVNAMELLINAFLRKGSRKRDLSVKVFGGGSVMGGELTSLGIGRANGEFVLSFLKAEGLVVLAQDLFGAVPRKVAFFPDEGKVRVKYLRQLKNSTVAERERDYASRIVTDTKQDVEIFSWPNKSVS